MRSILDRPLAELTLDELRRALACGSIWDGIAGRATAELMRALAPA